MLLMTLLTNNVALAVGRNVPIECVHLLQAGVLPTMEAPSQQASPRQQSVGKEEVQGQTTMNLSLRTNDNDTHI